jgi:uncharacterized protein YkwD
MTHAPKAASVRFGVAALGAAALAALFVTHSAQADERPSSAYLAPAGVCAGSADPAATPAVQRRAIACLVNWARRSVGMRSLARSRSLQRAAVLKGRKVASCGALTHSPCGSDPLAPLRASGYPYTAFAENLALGPRGQVTARDIVAAWIESPPHRANIFGAGFRNIGAALVGKSEGSVWVATFGSRR